MRILFFLLLLLFGQNNLHGQTNNCSDKKSFLWPFSLPSSKGNGPMDVNIRCEYNFCKESIGDSYYFSCRYKILSVEYKTSAVSGANITGSGFWFRYNGKEYNSLVMSTVDGLGTDGFDDIQITGASIHAKASGTMENKVFYLDNNFNNAHNISKCNKDASPVGLDINLVMSTLQEINYTNSDRLITRINNYERLIKNKSDYNNIIRDADLAFNSKDYPKAKQLYERASELLKNEQYPINQIKKIDDLIIKQQENEQISKYNKFIEKADAAFNQKDYSAARNFYTSALQLYPQEGYPKTQIDRINDILESQNSESGNSYSNSGNSSNSSNSSNGQSYGGGNNSSNSYSSGNSSNQSGNQSTSQNYSGSGKNNLSDKVMVQGVGYVQVYEQNGQYYMQREDGSSHVTSLEAYNSVQSTASKNKAIRDQNAKIQNDQKVAQQREIDRVNAHNENLLLENQKRIDNINRATDHLVSSFYTMQNINNLKSDVDANRTLGSNFKSIEEIEQAFNQKYSGLSQSMDNMHAEEQNLNLNTLNYMSTLEGDAGTTGTIVAGGLYLLNEFQNQKEKENALAELQRQRSEALAELERQKHQQLVDLRMEMLTTFPEGGIPLSSHKINVSEIYFFVYSLDESQITGQQPTVQVSNVFPWKKYTDGTWPYRTALDAELKNKGLTNKTTLVGFYSSKEMAEEMRSAYLKLAEMGKMRVENVALVGKPLNAAGGTNTKTANQTTDFWGEPTTPSSTKQQAAPKQAADDFWGEPVKPEAGSSTKGKTSTQPATTPKKTTNTEDDFWGAPVKQEPAKTTPAKPAPAKTTPAKPATPAKSNTPANNEKDFWGEPIKTTNEKKKP